MLNALTIDVEDYYHVSAFESVVQFEDWHRYESRVEKNTHRILDLLDEYGTKATFFVLGWVAEQQPRLVKEIHHRGHEVASHGYSHRRIYTQTREQFREETRRSKRPIEDLTGQSIMGYRAASYSITTKSLWALDILVEEGFLYDSSIFPVRHDLYGIPGYPRFRHVVETRYGKLIELPLSTLRVGKTNIPFGGGGYFRLYPYLVTRYAIRQINRRYGEPVIVYLHPWEIDPQQPRLSANVVSRFRHYCNLSRTESRLTQLLTDFAFVPIVDFLNMHHGLPSGQLQRS